MPIADSSHRSSDTFTCVVPWTKARMGDVAARSLLLVPGLEVGRFGTLCYMDTFLICSETLASCLINAQPLPAHRPAADNNSLIGCTGHDLTDDWSHSQYPFRRSFGCVLLLNQMF